MYDISNNMFHHIGGIIILYKVFLGILFMQWQIQEFLNGVGGHNNLKSRTLICAF